MQKAIVAILFAVALALPSFASAQGVCPAPLSRGMSGERVRAVQQLLHNTYTQFSAESVTGFYGPLTEAAVKQWQVDNNIVSSGTPATTGWGVAGPRTLRAMGLCPGGTTTPIPTTGTPPATTLGTCLLNGRVMSHGTSVTMYESFLVPAGQQCRSQVRTCFNSVLSGSYIYPVCSVSGQTSMGTTGTSTTTGSATSISSTTATTTAACVPPTRDLKLGEEDSNTSGQVSVLQRFLARDSVIYPEALVTGYFGQATERAVVRFQKAYNVSPTGFVGPLTRAAMQAKCAGTPPPQSVVVSFKATPGSGQSPLAVTFTAIGHEIRAGIVYVVDFGNNQRAEMTIGTDKQTVTHMYTTGGTFKARLLQVEYLCGGSSMGYGCDKELQVDGVTITVSAPPADPTSTPPTTGGGGTGNLGCVSSPAGMGTDSEQRRKVCFDQSGSIVTARHEGHPESGTSLAWGDGHNFTFGHAGVLNGLTDAHTYAAAGTYTIRVRFQSQNGAEEVSKVITIGGGGGGTGGGGGGVAGACSYQGGTRSEGTVIVVTQPSTASIIPAQIPVTCDNGYWMADYGGSASIDACFAHTFVREQFPCTGDNTNYFMAAMVGPRHGTAPYTISIPGQARFSGPGCSSHTINWGDGTTTANPPRSDGAGCAGPNVSHTYTARGTYTISYLDASGTFQGPRIRVD